MSGKQLHVHISGLLVGKYALQEAQSMAKWLLVDGLNIHQNAEQSIDPGKIENALRMVGRLLHDEPLDYVIGHSNFYGYSFEVNPDVLIPRPETELLVEQAIIFLKKQNLASPKVLDIGTGSGCIPITIKLKVPKAEVTSIDISPGALEVAEKNAEKHHTEISFYQIDFLKFADAIEHQEWDLIISNPPYILEEEKEVMSTSTLTFEPQMALFADHKDPLIFYDKIAAYANKYLGERGALLLEMNEFKVEEIERIVRKNGFQSTTILDDLEGKKRMLLAFKNHL